MLASIGQFQLRYSRLASTTLKATTRQYKLRLEAMVDFYHTPRLASTPWFAFTCMYTHIPVVFRNKIHVPPITQESVAYTFQLRIYTTVGLSYTPVYLRPGL